jgi:large subunit ribosomal protein L28
MPGRHKVTPRKPLFGRQRSHAFNTTNRKFKLNMQNKRYFVPELGRFVRVQVTAQEMKTIDKIGLLAYLKRVNIKVERLLD